MSPPVPVVIALFAQFFARGPRVHAATRPSLRPRFFRRVSMMQSSGESRRENADLCLKTAAPALSAVRSAILTLLWHCGCGHFSFRKVSRSGRRQPSVNRFDRRFLRSKGSGNADSQRNVGNRREGGADRPSRHDSGCVPAHPPSWASASYLPLRAGWARAPGHSGVFEDQRTLQRSERQRESTQKEFVK